MGQGWAKLEGRACWRLLGGAGAPHSLPSSGLGFWRRAAAELVGTQASSPAVTGGEAGRSSRATASGSALTERRPRAKVSRGASLSKQPRALGVIAFSSLYRGRTP